MPSLDMGSNYHELKKEVIETLKDGLIGNYALGYMSANNSFVVHYVGRSDTDLKQRLLQHLDDTKVYPYFKFSVANTVKEAYLKECKNFHDFGGEKYLDNKNHPAKPEGIKEVCPYCGK